MDNSRLIFGQYLTKKRKEKGVSLKQLASLVVKEDGQQVSFQYLSELENGRRKPPSDFVIKQIANALGIRAGNLFIKARRVPDYLDIPNEDIAADIWEDFEERMLSKIAA